MRLDFAWGEALSESTKSEIEEVSNLAIRADLAVSAQFMTLPEAKDWGAIALFGETYDEMVRVIQVGGPWSRELCGGTHVSRTAQIGLVTVTGESSVGSGSRRIEAEVGFEALSGLIATKRIVDRMASNFKVPAAELEQRVSEALNESRTLAKRLEEISTKAALGQVAELASSAKKVGPHNLVASRVDVESADALRQVAIRIRETLGDESVTILGAVLDGKPLVAVAVGSKSQQVTKAGDLARAAAAVLGGGGGGKPDYAQGGGTDAESLDKAIAEAARLAS